MKKLKGLFAVFLIPAMIIQMLTPFVSASAKENGKYSDINKDYACYTAVSNLSELNIINGYDDGTYKPWNYVTRAEFCKMVVAMQNKITVAKSTPPSSSFDDVNSVAWCIPYVNYLTSTNVIKGYADATFKPNNVITYAEAVTILCRLLGYNEEDIGYSWPSNYMNEAEALELAGEMEFSAKDPITRSAMAIIADNAMFTYVNGKSEVTFLESIGYTLKKDNYILSTRNEDSSLKLNEIRTTAGVYEAKNSDILNKCGKLGTLVLDTNNKAIMFYEDTLVSTDVVVTRVIGDDTIEYKYKNGKQTFTFGTNFTVYYANNPTTYQAVAQSVKQGTAIRLCGETENNWSFAIIADSSDSIVPVRATKNYTGNEATLEGIPINYDNLTVYKDNKTVSVSDIEVNDVIYYNTSSNIMDVYNKKVSGIYNKALPSKSYVTSVNVGGNVYPINKNVSTSSLDASNGSFEIGERVTLLLGENDEVCFAVELSDFSEFDYGVLLKSYKETSESGSNEGSSQIMASIFMADGKTYEYRADKKYDSLVGKLVAIKVSDGIVSLSGVSSSKIYGDLNVSQRTLGGKRVLKNVTVFHRLNSEDSQTVQIEILDFDKLDEKYIGANQLITSVSANAFGDISVLYLKEISSGYSYGIMVGEKSMGAETSNTIYTIYTNSNSEKYSSSARYSIQGGPIAFKMSSANELTDLKALYSIKEGTVQAIETGRIMIGGSIYQTDDNVLIVNISDISNYKTMSVSELAGIKGASASLYVDKKASTDSTVRVITVRY